MEIVKKSFPYIPSTNFVQDFQARLAQKRLHEAKYRVLEQLKANVWSMFESGQMRPFTAQRLKALVMDQIDELEAGKVVEANPLPFAPLKQALRHRPTVGAPTVRGDVRPDSSRKPRRRVRRRPR